MKIIFDTYTGKTCGNAVCQAGLCDVHHLLHPQLTHVRLGPVKCGDVAVHIAVVAEPHDLTVFVAEEAGQASRLHRHHACVGAVEREVEHGVPVKDRDLVRADGLEHMYMHHPSRGLLDQCTDPTTATQGDAVEHQVKHNHAKEHWPW